MFFAGRFRHRKASVLFGGLLSLVIGAVPLLLMGPELFRRTWTRSYAAGALVVGAVCGLMLFTGLKLLRQWLGGATVLLEISDQGVRYGGQDFAWDEVQWIGGTPSQGRVQLTLRRRGVAAEVQLSVDEPLTVDRYDALMQELSAALREKHPHVAVG